LLLYRDALRALLTRIEDALDDEREEKESERI